MTVSTRKAVVGITLSLILVGVVVPVIYWFVAQAIDNAVGWEPLTPVAVLSILGAFAILIGVFWVSWAYSYLLFVGQGLPLEVFGAALHPTKILVTTGPYAYTRNPSLIGMLFLLLGVALIQRSISGLIMVPVVIALIMPYLIAFEERTLARRFGEDYEQYQRNVPLLIPRLTPYVHEARS